MPEFMSQIQLKLLISQRLLKILQRDINIALINELSKIFNKLKIDTKDVLDVRLN